MPGAKQQLRAEVRARRTAIRPDERAAAGVALAAALRPLLDGVDSVAAYVSIGTEPPTEPLLAALRHHRVLLPVLRADRDLDWAEAGELVERRYGLREPTGPLLGPDAVAACGLVVVPALLVDAQGNRLGRGGGSYDRALQRARGTTVALVYDDEWVDEVPHEPHDVPVTAVATPSRGVANLSP